MDEILLFPQREDPEGSIRRFQTPGGQVYGKQRYDAFVGASANTPNEKAITIGAGQWYAGEAKRLLLEIQRVDPVRFGILDTQGIADDLKNKDWSRYAISPVSAKAKCIVSIISSSTGIRCQDWLMETQTLLSVTLYLRGARVVTVGTTCPGRFFIFSFICK